MSDDLVKMARLAQRDERMSTGALYGDLADRIEELEAKLHKAIWELEILGFDFESTLGRELMEVDDEYEDDEDE